MANTLAHQATTQKDIRALRIPTHDFPSLTQDDFSSLIRYVFYTKYVTTIKLDDYNTLIVSQDYNNQYKEVNFIATTLYRTYNPLSTKTIYGPVLAVGSPDEQVYDYQSITVNLIEDTINILNRFSYFKKQKFDY
jgi:hypothetical protein